MGGRCRERERDGGLRSGSRSGVDGRGGDGDRGEVRRSKSGMAEINPGLIKYVGGGGGGRSVEEKEVVVRQSGGGGGGKAAR